MGSFKKKIIGTTLLAMLSVSTFNSHLQSVSAKPGDVGKDDSRANAAGENDY